MTISSSATRHDEKTGRLLAEPFGNEKATKNIFNIVEEMALQPAQLDMIDIEKKTRAEKKNNIRQPTKGLGQQLRGFGGGEKIQRRWISVPAGVQPTALLWLAGRCIPGRSWLFGSISPNQRREQAKKGFAATLDFAAFVSAFSRTRRGSTPTLDFAVMKHGRAFIPLTVPIALRNLHILPKS